jgi:hypothetical protein
MLQTERCKYHNIENRCKHFLDGSAKSPALILNGSLIFLPFSGGKQKIFFEKFSERLYFIELLKKAFETTDL